MPAGWTPDADLVVYAVTQGVQPEDVSRIAEDFRDFWIAKSGADARKLDWPATWRRWVREEVKRKAQRRPPPAPQKRVGWV